MLIQAYPTHGWRAGWADPDPEYTYGYEFDWAGEGVFEASVQNYMYTGGGSSTRNDLAAYIPPQDLLGHTVVGLTVDFQVLIEVDTFGSEFYYEPVEPFARTGRVETATPHALASIRQGPGSTATMAEIAAAPEVGRVYRQPDTSGPYQQMLYGTAGEPNLDQTTTHVDIAYPTTAEEFFEGGFWVLIRMFPTDSPSRVQNEGSGQCSVVFSPTTGFSLDLVPPQVAGGWMVGSR